MSINNFIIINNKLFKLFLLVAQKPEIQHQEQCIPNTENVQVVTQVFEQKEITVQSRNDTDYYVFENCGYAALQNKALFCIYKREKQKVDAFLNDSSNFYRLNPQQFRKSFHLSNIDFQDFSFSIDSPSTSSYFLKK